MSVTKLPPPAWRDRLQISSSGAIKSNLYNCITAVRGIRPIADRMWWDEFRARSMVSCPLPWDDSQDDRAWSDYDDLKLTEYLQATDVPATVQYVQQAVQVVATEQRRHELREWLNGLEWDGTPRIHEWLTYHLGVDRTPYSQAVGKAWLISAVARVMSPGCKVDTVLVLEGGQGIGKSTAMRTLAGNRYFTDEIAELGSKDAAIQMQGAWIIEMAELDALGRAAIERTKSFLTRTNDRYRPPYGRNIVDQPRQCVFVGTSNDVEFRDTTGNRRFWPVQVRHVDIAGIKHDREQIWAEAVQAYHSRCPWWLDDADVIKEAQAEQEKRVVSEVWGELVDEYLAGKAETSITELLTEAIKVSADKWNRPAELRLASHLKANGWVRKKAWENGNRRWIYVRDGHRLF